MPKLNKQTENDTQFANAMRLEGVRTTDFNNDISALRRDYERLSHTFEIQTRSLTEEIRRRRETEAALRDTIEELKTQLADRMDYEGRLENQATDLVGMAEDLSIARNELQSLVRQRDRFFSIIAHDLRSPFTALLGFSEYLANQASTMPRDQVEEYSRLSHAAGERAFKLLENLLQWSQLQTGNIKSAPEVIWVEEIIDENIALFEAPARAKAQILRAKTVSKSCVYADPQMVCTILRNLINNAVKFTAEGGEISVTATDNAGCVRFAVRDNGVGIKPKDLARLFKLEEKVSTLGTNGEPSTGLGLQLCQELALRLGTRIDVESEPGVGSMFSFELQTTTK